MRALALCVPLALAALPVFAHGPQIQLTRDDSTITTRRLIREEPYAARLTPPTSVYVIPLLETGGVWYARPNNQPSATIPGVPEYVSGPGITYGYDQVGGGPRDFASGFRFELKLIDALKWWNGAAFVDPETEQIEAFRSSGAPAVTNDLLTPSTPATLAFGNVSASYNAEVHSSASFRLLGDGTNATAPSDDGVYLVRMLYASTEPGLAPSLPFYFVLHKNASTADVHSAVSTLGVATSLVQYVPEPTSALLLLLGVVCCVTWRDRQ
jgi:PEP-CTERM motif-containing protein